MTIRNTFLLPNDDGIAVIGSENVVINTSNRGVGIFVRGRGSVENVLFSNVIIHS